MKPILTILLISLLLLIHLMSLNSLSRNAQVVAEYAYFEGQKDALEGDIRIEKNSYGVWHWTSSPYDSGGSWIFDPSQSVYNQLNK